MLLLLNAAAEGAICVSAAPTGESVDDDRAKLKSLQRRRVAAESSCVFQVKRNKGRGRAPLRAQRGCTLRSVPSLIGEAGKKNPCPAVLA